MKKIFFVLAMVAVAALASCSPSNSESNNDSNTGVVQVGKKSLNYTGKSPLKIIPTGQTLTLTLSLDGNNLTSLPVGWKIEHETSGVLFADVRAESDLRFFISGYVAESGYLAFSLKNPAGEIDSVLEIPLIPAD